MSIKLNKKGYEWNWVVIVIALVALLVVGLIIIGGTDLNVPIMP